jgi:subfamily B ATP-binding cassette protein MsbA
MLKGASFLVLDEATSSLDSESEAVIQDALQGHFTEQTQLTSLIIAHRLSTVRNADALFVLEEGQVVEAGSHFELVKRGGLYSRLYALQVAETPTTN